MRARIDGCLGRFSKSEVKHHEKVNGVLVDGFAPEVAGRIANEASFRALVLMQRRVDDFALDCVRHVVLEKEIEYDLDEEAFAHDARIVAEAMLYRKSEAAARALIPGPTLANPIVSLVELTTKICLNEGHLLKSLRAVEPEKVLDIVPFAAERLLRSDEGEVTNYFRHVRDSYFLYFALRQAPDVQEALNSVIRGMMLIVDASIIVPCMCERLLEDATVGRMTQLLNAAKQVGVKLFASKETINELISTIHTANAIHQSYARFKTPYDHSELAKAYIEAGATEGFEKFLERFCDKDTPVEDLKEFLKSVLGIEFDDFADQRRQLDHSKVEDLGKILFDKRKVKESIDVRHIETLVTNDSLSIHLIDILRKDAIVRPGKGEAWWWMTRDFTTNNVDNQTFTDAGRKGPATMAPDFLLRHLSLAQRDGNKATTFTLPTAIEVSALGFIPAEVIKAVDESLKETGRLPVYLRDRKIRKMLNQERSGHTPAPNPAAAA